MGNKIPGFLLERPAQPPPAGHGEKLRMPFIERGVNHLAFLIRTGYLQWQNASADNFFQSIDARVKVLFLSFYVIIVSLKRDLLPEAAICAFVLTLVIISRLNIVTFYRRVIFLGFFFGFLVALPSALNLITPGEIVLPLIHMAKPHDFLIWRMPADIGITREGSYGVAVLTLRVMNSLALSFFLLHTTSFPEIMRALKVLRVPDTFIMIVALAYKYVFIFAKTVEDMHLAKKSRLAGQVSNSEARRWIAGRIVFLFRKTQQRCEEIFKAMLGRGFSGEIKIYGVNKLHTRDWITGAGLFMAAAVFLWM